MDSVYGCESEPYFDLCKSLRKTVLTRWTEVWTTLHIRENHYFSLSYRTTLFLVLGTMCLPSFFGGSSPRFPRFILDTTKG